MTSARYCTVTEIGRAELRVKGSRFIGFVAPAEHEEQARTTRTKIGERHSDATHVVSAYRIRNDPVREYQDDAGEPSGSAGTPVLGILQKEELEQVVAVVVRYYGGTNLGFGGLVRAYGNVTKKAIAATDVIEQEPISQLVIHTTYDDSGTVRGILDGSEAEFDATYEERVSFRARVPQSASLALRDRILSATSGRADISPST